MNSSQPLPQLIKRLWQHIGPRRRAQFWLLLGLMILSSFAEVLSIGAVLPFLGALTAPDRIFQHPAVQPFIHALGLTSAEQLLLPMTVTFGLAALFANALRSLLLWSSIRLSFAVGSNLSNGIYRRTLYQPYAAHIARNSSEVINVISTKVAEVIFYVLVPALNFISASVMLVAILLALLSIIPVIALGAFFGFGLIYATITRIAHRKLRQDSGRIARESTNVIKSLQEGLGGIRDILIDGSQEVFSANYRNADQALRRAQGSNQFLSQFPRYGLEALAMMLISTLAYVLAKQPGGISMAVPMLAAMALGMQRLLPALHQVYSTWTTIHGAQASLQDALALLDQPLPDYADQPDLRLLPFSRQIELRNISFRYGPKTPWVLRDISFTIPKGGRIGFIGTTGSGKSTLLDIVMGLLQPVEGVIEVDGQAVTLENQRAWQGHIAHVPQVVFLSDSTVLENIAFGVPKDKIDHERVRQAARQAQIADSIDAWPAQYQTNVGERGVQISGGQRQRIGIARALYKRADVLVFDESTNALDNETELAVMQSIEALNADLTILIIAHRLSTLKNCSQVIEIGPAGIQRKAV